MKIHAISTGHVRITNRFIKGKGRGFLRKLRVAFDSHFSEPLPVFCYLIEHPEGPILIDTGSAVNHLNMKQYPAFNRFFINQSAKFEIGPESDIHAGLKQAGFSVADLSRVIYTHLHQDHMGNLSDFSGCRVYVGEEELAALTRPGHSLEGYFLQELYKGFSPISVRVESESYGPFPGSYKLTNAGDVILVPTPGHSRGHMSVILKDGRDTWFFCGDSVFSLENLNAGQADGVCAVLSDAEKTLKQTAQFIRETNAFLLPSHDPGVPERCPELTVWGWK